MRQNLFEVHQQFADFFPGKVLAPFIYLLSKRLNSGHICLDIDNLEYDLDNLPKNYKNIIENEFDGLKNEKLIGDEHAFQPFILHGRMLYFKRYFDYETKILKGIIRLVQSGQAKLIERCNAVLANKELIEDLFVNNSKVEQIDWQKNAVILSIVNDFTIITGGPGTGKTTILAKLLAILYTMEPEIRIVLSAPTGKAAMRMAESLRSSEIDVSVKVLGQIRSLEPKTLHRLLGTIPDSTKFRHGLDDPLAVDMIVVDEASMVDVALFAKLMDAVPPGARLLILGDKNQLASVEAGSLLGDLCSSYRFINKIYPTEIYEMNDVLSIPNSHDEHPLLGHIIELRKSYRFDENSEIGRFSKSILEGSLGDLLPNKNLIIDHDYKKEILLSFFDHFTSYVQEDDILMAIQKLNSIKILCAVWEGDNGVIRLNQMVEEYLSDKRLITKDSDFYDNRPIMVSRNYNEFGIFNGDTGILRKDSKGILKAWFLDGKGGVRSMNPHYIPDMQTVFAMTIHKSQGSEYDEVLVILPRIGGEKILTKELLYTAVTRAKKKVTIQTPKEVLQNAVIASVKRSSGIFDRFETKPSPSLNSPK